MRRSSSLFWKVPKNRGVAPRFDVWNEKYEPWAHLKRMGKLVGTGFYIPPEWYNHFRMFPPMQNNFQQEQTQNPQNAAEGTQDDRTTVSAERLRLREELARKSRTLASEGMRYYNLFWVQKPLDAMERQYYRLQKQGIAHDVAIKKVLQEFYDTLSIKQRVAQIQSEEAKLSGGFITMREASTVLTVLSQLQKEQLTPHQVASLAADKMSVVTEGDVLQGTVERMVAAAPAAATRSPGEDDAAAAAATVSSPDTASASAEGLGDLLQEDAAASSPSNAATLSVVVGSAPDDSLPKLREVAADGTGDVDWFDMGFSYDLPSGGD